MRPLTIGVVLILFPACGKVKQAADRTKVMNDLKGLGIAYINFQDSNQKPPKSYQELAAYAQKMGESLPSGVANLTVTWGAGWRRCARMVFRRRW
ncbi:MAG TPA: hypothetical protein VLM40_11855 [Gemmata sp.]|nr:hypothetical protein [Gemmata sp.]